MRKKKPEAEGNNERWLLTYSDLITLLMVFFVIMYSMSNVNSKKYAQLAGSLNSAIGGGTGHFIGDGGSSSVPVNVPQVATDGTAQEQQEAKEINQASKKVTELIKSGGLGDSVTVDVQERGLIISVSDSFLFDSGKAEIKTEFEKKLVDIGKALNKLDNYIVVEGNTDNVPINTYEFKDNWDLAASRANNVLRILVNKSGISPDKIASRSNGQYRSKASNNSEAGRSKNRSVDIVVILSKFNSVENGNSK